DREHDAVAEAVVALAIGLVVALATLRDDEPAFFEQRVVVARKPARQRPPAFRRITEPEARGDLAGQAASLQVVDGARTALELLPVVLTRLGEHIAERGLPLLQLGGALALLRRPV